MACAMITRCNWLNIDKAQAIDILQVKISRIFVELL